MRIEYEIGDSRELLKEEDDESFDSCVTDSPYDIGFMGKDWDRSGIAFDVELWSEVFRVLKPGSYLLNFGGTRTYDLMVGAVRQAGFEIRDTIVWIYGQGFSKIGTWSERKAKEGSTKEIRETSRTMVDAGWEGWGGALKPAIDLIVQARKPIAEKNVAMNVLTHGVGGLNIDATRIEGNVGKPWGRVHPHRGNYPGWQLDKEMVEAPEPHPQGRFPSNLILECICDEVIPGKVGRPSLAKHEHTFGDGEIYGTAKESVKTVNYGDTAPIHTNPNCPCYVLDAQSGETISRSGGESSVTSLHNWKERKGMFTPGRKHPRTGHDDSGGCSRFFYVAKASRRERWFYCSVCKKAYSGDKREGHKKHSMHCLDCGVDYEPQRDFVEGSDGAMRSSDPFAMVGGRNYNKPIDEHRDHNTKSNLLFHVTQKPEQLIRYLIRLVTPPGGTVLDPFVGSGTTLVSARMEGMNALGIEIGTEYEPLISARIAQKSIYQFAQETE